MKVNYLIHVYTSPKSFFMNSVKNMNDKKRYPVTFSTITITVLAILAMVLLKDVIVSILAYLSEGGWRLTLAVIGTIIVSLLISHKRGG